MFIAALFTIVKIWKQTKCPSADEWIKKMWYICIYTMDCYSAIKKNEILPFATTCIDLEGIMLSERSQEEDKARVIGSKEDISRAAVRDATEHLSGSPVSVPKPPCHPPPASAFTVPLM